MNTVDITKMHNIIEEVYPSTSMGDWGLKEMLCVQVFEYAKNQMLDKACEWLREYTDDYIVRDTDESWLREGDFIRDFTKAMGE